MASKLTRALARFLFSPWWPACLSGLVAPGLGQVANRQWKKGLFLLTISLGSSYWFFQRVNDQLSLVLPGPPEQWNEQKEAFRTAYIELAKKYPETFLSFYALMIVVWVYSVYDAFTTARRRRLA